MESFKRLEVIWSRRQNSSPCKTKQSTRNSTRTNPSERGATFQSARLSQCHRATWAGSYLLTQPPPHRHIRCTQDGERRSNPQTAQEEEASTDGRENRRRRGAAEARDHSVCSELPPCNRKLVRFQRTTAVVCQGWWRILLAGQTPDCTSTLVTLFLH